MTRKQPQQPGPKKDQHSFDPKKRAEVLKEMEKMFSERSEEELPEEPRDHGM